MNFYRELEPSREVLVKLKAYLDARIEDERQ